MCLEELIKKATNDNFYDILEETFNCVKPSCKKHLCKKIYKIIYGNTLIPELCEEYISCITSAPKWTLEETNNIAKKLEYDFSVKPYTPEEFRTAMIIEEAEHSTPLKASSVVLESTTYGRIADHWLINSPGRLVRDYFHSCCQE